MEHNWCCDSCGSNFVENGVLERTEDKIKVEVVCPCGKTKIATYKFSHIEEGDI